MVKTRTCLFEKQCRICKTNYKFQVPEAGLKRWQEGARIQEVLPMLTPDQRELMISGICGKCFDKMFREE